jgi:hypothetical protein
MGKPLYTPAIQKYNTRTICGLLSGSSRRGTLKASREDLERALGRSHMPQIDSKVDAEYVFIDNQSGRIVTVYSYKGSASYGEWSIGGWGHPVLFEEWLKRQIATYRRRAVKMAALKASKTVFEHLQEAV